MTLAAIDLYSISVFIHVSAVIVGFGATFASSVMFPLAMKVGTRHVPYVHRVMLAINERLATPALAIVLLTGVYQTSDGDWGFGSFWISATFAIVIVLGGLIGAVFIPSERRMAALAEKEIAAAGGGDVVLSEDYRRQARRAEILGGVAGLLILAAVFLMVTKPGA